MSNAPDPVSLKPKEIAPVFPGSNTQPELTPQPVTGGAIYFQKTNSPEAAQEPEAPVGERTIEQLRGFLKKEIGVTPAPLTIEELHPSFGQRTDASTTTTEAPTKSELVSAALGQNPK